MNLISQLILVPAVAAGALRGRYGRSVTSTSDRRLHHRSTKLMKTGKKKGKKGRLVESSPQAVFPESSPPTVAPIAITTNTPSTTAMASEAPMSPTLISLDLKVKHESNTFCDTGPDALTTALTTLTQGRDIPRFCIPNPITGERERCYYLFVPECAFGEIPLVMNMHGRQSCPQFSVFYDQWAQVAQRHCFALAYPIGITDPAVADTPCFNFPAGRSGAPSSCCCERKRVPLAPDETQDLLVMRNMIHDVILATRVQALSNHTAEIDPTRVYMTGHSNGCLASLAMGAVHSDLVAAVCCHSGDSYTPFPPDYKPVPTWIGLGLRDTSFPRQRIERTMSEYGNAHNCSAVATTKVGMEGDTETTYFDCADDANVTLLTVVEGGHIPFLNIGVPPVALDTTEMAYQFCSGFRKESVPDGMRF